MDDLNRVENIIKEKVGNCCHNIQCFDSVKNIRDPASNWIEYLFIAKFMFKKIIVYFGYVYDYLKKNEGCLIEIYRKSRKKTRVFIRGMNFAKLLQKYKYLNFFY